MNYDEFKRQIGKAGLSIREFSDLVKANRISFSNLKKKGEVPSHWVIVAVLMAEMAEHRLDFRTPVSNLDIEPKKPRGSAKHRKFGGDKQEPSFAAEQQGASDGN